MGVVSVIAGALLSFVALALGMSGWQVTRLWFYLLASALLSIVGIQLLVAWIVMRVLEQLAQREAAARRDLNEIQV